MLEIENHCFSETRTEVGGFLVGTISGTNLEVTHVLRAKHTVAQMTQLTFTHKTWDTVFAELSKIDKDAKLIGWYHSHPNFGVFLSDHDKFIQSQFFGNDGQITIVVDPIRGRSGWFVSNDKQIEVLQEERDTKTEKLGGSDIVENIQNQAALVASTSDLTWGRVVGVAAVFSVMSMIGGYLLGGTSGNSNSQIATLERQLAILSGQIQELSSRVDGVSPKVVAPTPKPVKPADKEPSKPKAQANVPKKTAEPKKTAATSTKTGKDTTGSKVPANTSGTSTNTGKSETPSKPSNNQPPVSDSNSAPKQETNSTSQEGSQPTG